MIVGSDKVYAIENFYVRHLREAGVVVDHFAAQAIFLDYYQKSLFNKLLFKTGLSGITRGLNNQFIDKVKELKPDTIWIFKGMELMPASLEKAKKSGAKLVNYNPDNPFIFTGKGSGNQFITDSIGIYDLHFTYNLAIEKILQQQYKARTAFLPFGFEISDALYAACAGQKEIIKACFLGNPDKQRAAFIQALAEEGVKMDVYGNDWKQFVHHSGIQIFNPVYGDNLWKVLRRYRVQLNLMRIHNEDSHNMRSFEVPGIGGIMVAPDTTEHRLFFEDGKEAFLFKDVQHCARQINDLLNYPVAAADEIRSAARIRSVSSGYSYKDRAGLVLKTIQDLHG